MKRYFNKNLKILIAALVILVVMSVFSVAGNPFAASALNSCTKGIFRITSSITASADTASYEELAAENEKLKNEASELRNQLADYYDIKAENERLQGYFKITENIKNITTVPAQIIRRDVIDDYHSFTLDIGKKSGVAVDNPVITENGLVGRVSSVNDETCVVSTILAPSTKVGAKVSRTGDLGIISGTAALSGDNLTKLSGLDNNNTIKTDDILVTLGGGVYPSGIIIGKVKDIVFDSESTVSYATVEPYDDISKLTDVAVITDFDGKGKVTE